MITEVLTLTQWLSPAYPVGAFAYSHGLEAAIGARWVTHDAHLLDWLGDIVTHGSGRNDCILLRAAYGNDVSLAEINDIALAFAASSERRSEALLQGAAFVKVTAKVWGVDDGPLAYPVAVGAAGARLGIDQGLACALYLQAMMSNLIAAAQRLMPLGQTEGQAVLRALTPLCQSVAQDTAGLTVDDLQSATFLSDIAAMRHETQNPRIFRT